MKFDLISLKSYAAMANNRAQGAWGMRQDIPSAWPVAEKKMALSDSTNLS